VNTPPLEAVLAEAATILTARSDEVARPALEPYSMACDSAALVRRRCGLPMDAWSPSALAALSRLLPRARWSVFLVRPFLLEKDRRRWRPELSWPRPQGNSEATETMARSRAGRSRSSTARNALADGRILHRRGIGLAGLECDWTAGLCRPWRSSEARADAIGGDCEVILWPALPS
jgi:hypothetical protein